MQNEIPFAKETGLRPLHKLTEFYFHGISIPCSETEIPVRIFGARVSSQRNYVLYEFCYINLLVAH